MYTMVMIMTHPPAFYPANFLMRTMNSANSGLMFMHLGLAATQLCTRPEVIVHKAGYMKHKNTLAAGHFAAAVAFVDNMQGKNLLCTGTY